MRKILLLAVLFVMPAISAAQVTEAELGEDLAFAMPVELAKVVADAITGNVSYSNTLTPVADDTYDVGTSSLEWQDGFFDGTLALDAGRVDESLDADAAGGATIGATSPFSTITAGDGTIGIRLSTSSGNTSGVIGTTTAHELEFRTSNTEVWEIDTNGDLIPSADGARDIGASSTEVDNIYVEDIVISAGAILPSGTDLPDSPAAGDYFLDTNDGACDDANDSGGTVVCAYNGSAWIVLGNTGS